jgi:hypothetical protein
MPSFSWTAKPYPSTGRPFCGSAILACVALLFLALASDVGGLLQLWSAPMFLLHGGFDAHAIITLSKTILPGSVLSGIVDSGWSRLSRLCPV